MGSGDSTAASLQQEPRNVRESTGPMRVLHVDDEQTQVELAVEFFERADAEFDVETATSVEEGLAVLAEQDIHCVISDYDMPGMDGLEFFEAVSTEYPGVPFILFTGQGGEAVASEAVSAGVTDYIEKEGNADQYDRLVDRVREVGTAGGRPPDGVDFPVDQYDRLLEVLPAGVYVTRDREFVYVNATFADLFGYTPEALLDGMGLTDLCERPPAELDDHRPDSDDDRFVSYRVNARRANDEQFPAGIRERRGDSTGRPSSRGSYWTSVGMPDDEHVVGRVLGDGFADARHGCGHAAGVLRADEHHVGLDVVCDLPDGPGDVHRRRGQRADGLGLLPPEGRVRGDAGDFGFEARGEGLGVERPVGVGPVALPGVLLVGRDHGEGDQLAASVVREVTRAFQRCLRERRTVERHQVDHVSHSGGRAIIPWLSDEGPTSTSAAPNR